MSHKFYLVVRFYLRLKISIFGTPHKLLYSNFNLFKFKYYAWVSCGTVLEILSKNYRIKQVLQQIAVETINFRDVYK